MIACGSDRPASMSSSSTLSNVAESEPPGFNDEAVVRAIRQWRFRPRVENGVVVGRDDVALRVNFRYLPDDQAEPAE